METEHIRRAQAGDQGAFGAIVQEYHALVWRTIRVIIADRSLTEDIAQDAWLQVWLSLPRFDATRPLRPWLLAIVANRCRMAVRRPRVASISLDAALPDEAALVLADDVAERAIHAELRAHIARVCAALPPEQQRVLLLRYFADLDLAEIAVVLTVPLGTVKSRLHRALQAVREQLTAVHANDGEIPHE